jgi:hypothetical protein
VKKRDAWWLLMFLAGYVVMRRPGSSSSSSEPSDPPPPREELDDMAPIALDWQHPKPYLPTISDGYSPIATPGHRRHLGLDVMYERRWRWSQDQATRRFVGRQTSGNGQYFFPWGVPIAVAADGVIWDVVRSTTRGIGIFVVHQSGTLGTWYQHLADTVKPWKRNDRVARGTVLGHQGFSPNGDAPIHLHFGFKVWNRDRRSWSWKDPTAFLSAGGWPVVFDHVV